MKQNNESEETKSKIRILQFPVGNSKGGITHYVMTNWKNIDKSRFQFDFATMSKTFDYEEELIREGCKVFHIEKYAEEDYEGFIRAFSDILRTGNYDAVHLHTSFWKNTAAEKAAKEAGIKRIIIHAHNARAGGITEDLDRRKELELIHNRIRTELTDDIATDYWACSRTAADFLFGDRISREKIVIVPNAINLSKFSYDNLARKKIRNEWHVEDKFVIGNIGRYVFQKNQEFLIEVAPAVLKQIPEAVFMLVGEGPNRKRLENQARELGISEKIIFTGYSNNPEQFFSAFDLFAFPSRFEGLGIVLIEAQESGLDCIVSNDIPEEAKLTQYIEFVPLNRQIWIQEICMKYMKLVTERERIARSTEAKELLTAAGFDIHEQIKKLEKAYIGQL